MYYFKQIMPKVIGAVLKDQVCFLPLFWFNYSDLSFFVYVEMKESYLDSKSFIHSLPLSTYKIP